MKDFINNSSDQRFELHENGETAYATYRIDGKTLFIDYVFAPVPLRGTGAAGRLMALVVDYANEKALDITPVCGYAKSWLKRNG